MPDMPEDHEEEPEGLDKPPPFFPYDEEEEEHRAVDHGEPVEVGIEGVFAAESNGNIHRFVLLSDGHRKLSILIGPFEISMPLENVQPDRPMTHDLIRNLMDRLDCKLDRVVIDDLWSTTYYAKLYVQAKNEELVLDSRPSDAIALAVRFGAPIFVADGILEYNNE
jgi:hypothetical protein